MTYQIEWHTEDHIISLAYDGILLLEEAEKPFRDFVLPALNRRESTIHLIVDCSLLRQFDFSILQAVESTVARSYLLHAYTGWTICILREDDHYSYLLISFLRDHLNNNVHFVSSFEDALAFLREQDPSI